MKKLLNDGTIRATLELIIIPIIIFAVFIAINKHYSLIAPFLWVLFISFLHFLRLMTNTRKKLKKYSIEFFKFLRTLIIAIFIMTIFAAILVVGGA